MKVLRIIFAFNSKHKTLKSRFDQWKIDAISKRIKDIKKEDP